MRIVYELPYLRSISDYCIWFGAYNTKYDELSMSIFPIECDENDKWRMTNVSSHKTKNTRHKHKNTNTDHKTKTT